MTARIGAAEVRGMVCAYDDLLELIASRVQAIESHDEVEVTGLRVASASAALVVSYEASTGYDSINRSMTVSLGLVAEWVNEEAEVAAAAAGRPVPDVARAS